MAYLVRGNKTQLSSRSWQDKERTISVQSYQTQQLGVLLFLISFDLRARPCKVLTVGKLSHLCLNKLGTQSASTFLIMSSVHTSIGFSEPWSFRQEGMEVHRLLKT